VVTGSVLALLLAAAAPNAASEALVSLDVRDADVRDVVGVLARAAELQPVFDPDVECRLTLKVKNVSWRSALDAALRACKLGAERDAPILRVATVGRLTQEAADRKRLAEERVQRPAERLFVHRLHHARVQEMAPLLKALLPPKGDVTYDARTNTLLITY
jgi:type IV pilus assembly protein PilQ